MSISGEASERARMGFPSPFEVPIPSACEGWEELYAYHLSFSKDRRAFDEDRFWFQDGVHFGEPLYPFDAAVTDCAVVAFNNVSSRLFVIPSSLGIEYRILNGYVYLSANSVTDETVLDRRAQLFAERGDHYYEHWNELYAGWRDRVETATSELEALQVPDLPEVEDESVVTEGRGLGSSFVLLAAYDRLLEGVDRIMQYHFEFLNLGYGAYFAFYELCRQAFPDITDQTVAKMVSGIDAVLWQPDAELKRLAALALALGVAEPVKGAVSEEELRARLARSEGGERWLADFDKTKNPWFYFSYGTGAFYHHHRSWVDDTTLPVAMIGSYVARLEAGEDIARPVAAVLAERERVTDGYSALLQDDTRKGFDESLALARTVFPYVEDHNFYIDHRYLTIFWNKVRDFGALLARHEFLADGEDVFYLRHDEVRTALEELRISWSTGGAGVARGPGHWPRLVEQRKGIYNAMRRWSPPPALGRVPDDVTEPVTVMLWGITPERVRQWLSVDGDEAGVLSGVAGSSGVAEGRARVILDVEQLAEIEDGEILVAPTTATSWTPVFCKIAAAVLDVGGIMSHAAIVAREYGLPAVLGTGTATKRIKTGDRIRVDADSGVVEILS
jgi:pyruvate,water dikinase